MIIGMERDTQINLPDVLPDRERLERDKLEYENHLLREAYTETQVIFEDARIDFVDVRVPRSLWLKLRGWRAADLDSGRPGAKIDYEYRVMYRALVRSDAKQWLGAYAEEAEAWDTCTRLRLQRIALCEVWVERRLVGEWMRHERI